MTSWFFRQKDWLALPHLEASLAVCFPVSSFSLSTSGGDSPSLLYPPLPSSSVHQAPLLSPGFTFYPQHFDTPGGS
uniref:Uncharacterized protein n=1 Tax=Anguilla anguilla TaxID=7936 RepID=A0A0E9W0J3_ANGAN